MDPSWPWLTPYRSSTSQRVTVKTASVWPLKNERRVLEAVRDHPCIRPIVDTVDDPPSLILRYLDGNLLNASSAKKLESADIQYVARNLLQALEALHSRGYVHTATWLGTVTPRPLTLT